MADWRKQTSAVSATSGLSTAMTDRSSYKIGIGSQPGSSMKLGLAIHVMVAADVNRLKQFKEYASQFPWLNNHSRCSSRPRKLSQRPTTKFKAGHRIA